MKQLRDRMIGLRDIAYSNRRKKGFMAFCQATPIHFFIVLEVAIAQLEDKKLPGNLGSRSTIGYVLDDFVRLGYMSKSVGADKRKRVFAVSKTGLRLLDDYFEQRQVSLKEVA
jgi:hypothetical protein